MQKSNRHRKKPSSRWPLAIGLLLFLAFILLSFVVFKVFTLDKFIFINKTKTNGAEIYIIDSKNDKTVKYLIPADVELDSSRGYGNYKLSSLWQLSEKDENKGRLISETITKNYLLPVSLWKNGRSSNLSIYQKIKVLMVEKYSFLNAEKLDSKKITNAVLVNFIDPKFAENTPKIQIDDLTGSQMDVSNVSRIIEVLGGKVIFNTKGYNADLECLVTGKNLEDAIKIAHLFDCSYQKKTSDSVDIQISLGAKFAERF